ncbi:MAG TPA: cell division protein FtsQ [Cyclobacteriaceae bacterium]|nr:cell division protein FtsQ [Cyclobacteriaceae bacterium]
MKKFKFNIKREIKLLSASVLLVFLIAFSERKQDDVTVHDLVVKLENVAENHFLNEADILKLMKLNVENLKGASLEKINLRELEQKIKLNRFVDDADIFRDLKGNLVVKVSLRRPIARIVRSDGPDGYVAEDGTIMPVSDDFTSRVVLLSGSYIRQLMQMQNVNDSDEGKGLMEMLRFIEQNNFWKAQIAQLDMNSTARISIYPQVGGELIEFGEPENIDVKFKKLMIYYKEILPRMGWNKYKRVNLEYEGQIVAE